MKIEFTKQAKANEDIEVTKLVRGSHDDLLKMRKESAEDFQKKVQDVMDGWNGEPLAIVQVKEDSKGKPSGAQILVVGAGSPLSQMRLAKGLDSAATATIDMITKGIGSMDSVEDMVTAIKQMSDYVKHLDKED